MSNVTRHPSAPRKSAPPSPRQPIVIPVLVCNACKDPVVPNVRAVQPSWIVTIFLLTMAIVPALLYLMWIEQQRRTAVTCPQCGRADLVPLDSTTGRELLGDRFDAVVAQGKRLAGELAREQERQRASTARMQRVAAWALLAVLACAAIAFWAMQPATHEPTAEETFAELQRQAAEAQAAREAAPVAAAAPKPAAPAPKVLTIAASGTAAAKPHGEPVMRVTAGETYQQGEERDGWIRLKDAPVEAWVEASAVSR